MGLVAIRLLSAGLPNYYAVWQEEVVGCRFGQPIGYYRARCSYSLLIRPFCDWLFFLFISSRRKALYSVTHCRYSCSLTSRMSVQRSHQEDRMSACQKHANNTDYTTVEDAAVLALPTEVQECIFEACDLSQLVCLLQRNSDNTQACHEIKRAARRPKFLITPSLRELSNPTTLEIIQCLCVETKLVQTIL